MSDPNKVGHFSDRRCPRCGSTLLVNAEGRYWCSFIGGREEKPCTFGIDGEITAAVLDLPESLRDPIATLERRLREERVPEAATATDGDRIDWLERLEIKIQGNDYQWRIDFADPPAVYTGETLREAIDEAMKGEAKARGEITP